MDLPRGIRIDADGFPVLQKRKHGHGTQPATDCKTSRQQKGNIDVHPIRPYTHAHREMVGDILITVRVAKPAIGGHDLACHDKGTQDRRRIKSFFIVFIWSGKSTKNLSKSFFHVQSFMDGPGTNIAIVEKTL